MKMNLENLYYMVMEHFDNTANYHKIRLECWEKQNGHMRKWGATPKTTTLYVDHLKDKDASKFARAHERSECGERAIWEFCNILGIDQHKLYSVVKGIKKWHEARDWQACFPFTDKNNEIILGYIKA